MLALLACVWPVGAGRASDSNNGGLREARERLDVLEQYSLPMREVSGLALAQGGADGIDIYAVGDADYEVGRFRTRESPHVVSIDVRDVAGAMSAGTQAVSQWEAVATDASPMICALAEDSARVTCLGGDLARVVAEFELDVTNIPSLESSWSNEPNSRGEGMVLLRRGHVLLLKEKKPALIIEFGPLGETPMGWSADSLLGDGQEFMTPASHVLVALKVWELADSLAAIADDGSELAVGPDRRLYMLSQKSALLIRLESTLRPDEDKVHASALWQLPHDFEHAEGLAIDGGMHPWVAVDNHETDRPNLFRLTPIEPR